MTKSRTLSEVQRSQLELFLQSAWLAGGCGAIPGVPGGPSAMEIAIIGEATLGAAGRNLFIRVSENLGYALFAATGPTSRRDLAWVREAFSLSDNRPLHPVWALSADGRLDDAAKHAHSRYAMSASMNGGAWRLHDSGFGAPASTMVRVTRVDLRNLVDAACESPKRKRGSRGRLAKAAWETGIILIAVLLADAIAFILGMACGTGGKG